MYAVIKSGGKQYRVEQGEEVKLEKLNGDIGDSVVFEQVLLTSDDGNIRVGKPFLKGSVVRGRILHQGRDRKVVVFKYKRRKGFRNKRGHRQSFTQVKIESITA